MAHRVGFYRHLIFYACTAGLLLTRGAAWAQGFTFIAADTVLLAPLGSEVIFNTTVQNTGSSQITLAFVRTVNDLPADWQSSLCFSLCFAPFIDSIATTGTFGSSPINPGDSRVFSVHVLPQTTPGTGVVRIVTKDVANPSDQIALTFRTTATSTSAPIVGDATFEFSLSQNYPNPFNPSTVIGFRLPASGQAGIAQGAHVTLKVYDPLGREVATLVNESKPAGAHAVRFDGSALATGIYYYRLEVSASSRQSAGFVSTKKFMLLK